MTLHIHINTNWAGLPKSIIKLVCLYILLLTVLIGIINMKSVDLNHKEKECEYIIIVYHWGGKQVQKLLGFYLFINSLKFSIQVIKYILSSVKITT